MANGKNINYFKIGTFVITSLTIVIIGILVLGSGKLFEKTIYIETYFNESVQGLTVGAPVKYRGMDIGRVTKITFVSEVYNNKEQGKNDLYSRYIYVEMAITDNILTSAPRDELDATLKKDIAAGLRAKLTLQGLTGTTFLELDFLNPRTNTILPIDWKPKHYYVPSAVSALTRFSDNVQEILDKLKEVDYQKLFNNLDKLTNTTNKVMRRTNYLMAHTHEMIANTMANAQKTSANIRAASEQFKDNPSFVLFGKAPPKLNPGDL